MLTFITVFLNIFNSIVNQSSNTQPLLSNFHDYGNYCLIFNFYCAMSFQLSYIYLLETFRLIIYVLGHLDLFKETKFYAFTTEANF